MKIKDHPAMPCTVPCDLVPPPCMRSRVHSVIGGPPSRWLSRIPRVGVINF